MANLNLKPVFTESVYQFESNDDVTGGEDGIYNRPLKQLGNRTEWLKEQVDAFAPSLDYLSGEEIPESIADKLEYLKETKLRIGNAIIAKGIEITNDTPFRVYADFIIALGNIGSGAGGGDGGEGGGPPTYITTSFLRVTADGSETETSTELTLVFTKTIYGLSEDDITISGIQGLVKGTISNDGTTYTLPISGFKKGAVLTVSVAKPGYAIANPARTVEVYCGDIYVSFDALTANGSASVTSTSLTLTFSEAIEGLTKDDITLAGVEGVVKGNLSGNGPSYTLAISGLAAGGSLEVQVAKEGYEIANWTRTVAVYYAIPVTFSSVTQNGSASATTTQLTLTFSEKITGLAAADITLSGVAGVVRGALSGSGPTYTLKISGLTAGGTLTVKVAKSGYEISNSSRTVTVYYKPDIAVTFSSVTANGSATPRTTALTLTFSEAIEGLTNSNITLSGVGGIKKGTLSVSGTTYTMPISGFTAGGTLTVNVAKAGYAISDAIKTVTVYYMAPLTRITANPLSAARCYLAAASVGNYALFAGGGIAFATMGGDTEVWGGDTVDAYDAALTRSIPLALGTGRDFPTAASFGGYALFGGGKRTSTTTNVVESYDAALTRRSLTPLSVARQRMGAACVGGYVLFAGGLANNGSAVSDKVDAYDAALTRSTPLAMIYEESGKSATSIGNYAVFGGGISTVYAYSSSLQLTTVSVGATGKESAAVSVGNYALFAGGSFNGAIANVRVINSSLTKIDAIELSDARRNMAAASAGYYALVGGGLSGDTNKYTDIVDAFCA
jgi:hypothetical protein